MLIYCLLQYPFRSLDCVYSSSRSCFDFCAGFQRGARRVISSRGEHFWSSSVALADHCMLHTSTCWICECWCLTFNGNDNTRFYFVFDNHVGFIAGKRQLVLFQLAMHRHESWFARASRCPSRFFHDFTVCLSPAADTVMVVEDNLSSKTTYPSKTISDHLWSNSVICHCHYPHHLPSECKASVEESIIRTYSLTARCMRVR